MHVLGIDSSKVIYFRENYQQVTKSLLDVSDMVWLNDGDLYIT